ncbi:NEDD8 transferase [Aureococcus anophagefferens]|nr:NEDD8 transferase [Aureococcus anophagefferens]
MPLAAGQRGLITSELRVKKDLVELASQKFTCRARGSFALSLRVPANYPFRPPSVYCLTRVWHPNVCVDGGRVSHPLLDRDWKPVLSINTVIFGLQLLFLEPNPEHAANGAAARALLADRNGFAAQVRETMRGGTFLGYEFPRHSIAPRRRPAAGGRGARRDARHHSNDAPPPPATARRRRRPPPGARARARAAPSRYEAFEELFPFPVGDGGLPDFEGTDLSHEEQCLRSVDALLESTSNDAFRVRFLEEFRFRLAEGFTSFPTLDELHYALFEAECRKEGIDYTAKTTRLGLAALLHPDLPDFCAHHDAKRPANVKRKKVAAARAPADNAPAATVHMRGTFRRDPPAPRASGRRTAARPWAALERDGAA